MKDLELNDLERDTLIEIFNIGMGKAAQSLSIISKQEVQVSIPDIKLNFASEVFKNEQSEYLACIIQKVNGEFQSISVLIFPQEGSYEIVSKMLGSYVRGIAPSHIYQDALREIGNILINSCIGTIASSINMTSFVELPLVQFGDSSQIFESNFLEKDSVILNVGIDLHLMESNVSGKLFFIFGPLSLQHLREALSRFSKQYS